MLGPFVVEGDGTGACLARYREAAGQCAQEDREIGHYLVNEVIVGKPGRN